MTPDGGAMNPGRRTTPQTPIARRTLCENGLSSDIKSRNRRLPKEIPGIHHVTAIAGEPQQNIDFYADLLGLRLVKLTVNYDDPETYHLYYGDEDGHPGTILTFFPWPGAPRGRKGAGQITTTSFSIPRHSVGYWVERLGKHGVGFTGPVDRFDEQLISFSDPDGLNLELAAHSGESRNGGGRRGGPPGRSGRRRLGGIASAGGAGK